MSRSTSSLPIAVSMGDPAGIGPEIIVKACARLGPGGPRLRIIGDPELLRRRAQALDLPVPPDCVSVTQLPADLPIGQPSALTGDAAYRYIEHAARLALSGEARALVTAPIAKHAMQAAGHHFPGHTELLAHLAGDVPVRMMLANHELRTVLVSVHQSLRSAVESLDHEKLVQTLLITAQAFRRFGLPEPRIAVAGLNPHAGEGGLFGREELDLIIPALQDRRLRSLLISGPHAPDTVFMRARGFTEFDVVIAMYHDQGLIPIKYMGLDQGVNITLGLPFVRTSPDHGTAFDIAPRLQADPASLIEAITQADQLSRASGAS